MVITCACLLVYYISNTLLSEEVWLLTKIELSTRVGDSLLVTEFTIFTRIVYWHARIFISFKAIIFRRDIRHYQPWPTVPPMHVFWFHATTSFGHVLYILTNDRSSFLCDHASTIWLTNKPVINS